MGGGAQHLVTVYGWELVGVGGAVVTDQQSAMAVFRCGGEQDH